MYTILLAKWVSRTKPFLCSTDISHHSSPFLHCQIKSKKSPETFTAVRKGGQEKILHQLFSSLPGNTKQSNQLYRPVLSIIFNFNGNVIIKFSKLMYEVNYNGTSTPYWKQSLGCLRFGHPATLTIIWGFQVGIVWSFHSGYLVYS